MAVGPMIVNEALELVLTRLTEKNLSGALVAMDSYLSAHPKQNDAHRVEAVRADFQLMTDYWRRGYKDPQLNGLYDNLLRRMYVIYANAALGYAVGHSSYLSSVYMRLTLTARDWSVQSLKESLEAHVSEVAMLELEPENKRGEKRKEIFRRHHQLMSEWFDNIWLSTIWTDGQASAIEELLLSPTIDVRDQQLLVSGIMIAAINYFDVAKFRTLLHVYRQASDETVRQRALVGWVMSLRNSVPVLLYREDLKEMETLLEDEKVCEELVQLQEQIIFCINAEKDNQTIQKDIMPDLLKNSNFRVTRHGIEEIEEDSLEDILHPDAEERRMEQMEESFQKMQQMQKQGSDIYFGGFSQMKRFSFFQDICNWFVPYYTDHPGISELMERFQKNRFLQTIVSVGPFCNSDKYSFLLAFSQVMERIPEQLRQMMEAGEAAVTEVMQEESRSAAYIRRMYLQDIYRFYRIYPKRGDFYDPFDRESADYIFMAHPAFMRTHLEPYFNEVAAFMIKQKLYEEAGMVLENCGEARRDFRYYMMAGYLVQHGYFQFEGEELTDRYFYQKALEFQPDSERALLGYARALFRMENYEEALGIYDRLLTIQPGKRNYLLNRAVCLSKLKRFADAQKDLYRLNYEMPDDQHVNRVLAWTLTCDDKFEQADRIYGTLLGGNPAPEDLLNYGYCLWLRGHVDDAADCFHRYLKESDDTPLGILSKERDLLLEKGITEAEMQLMLYIL